MHLSEKELSDVAKNIYESFFHEPFNGRVKWSKKMYRIAGNCRSDGKISLNYYYYLYYGKDEIIKILRHELCHLYCFRKIGKHNDSNEFFQMLVHRIGGVLKGKPIPRKIHIYYCPSCLKEWKFRSKVNRLLSCNHCSNGSFNSNYRIMFKETVFPIAMLLNGTHG